MTINDITRRVIGTAIHVHTQLGPGLLEGAYEACMASELARLGLAVERQKPLPVVFNGMVVDVGYRLDPVVEQRVVLEVKAVEKLGRIHTAQMLTYLRFSGCSVGLLLNFNVLQMKDGIRRVVLGLKE